MFDAPGRGAHRALTWVFFKLIVAATVGKFDATCLGSKNRTRLPGSVFGREFDDGVSRFGLVRCQTRQISVGPICKIYNPRRLSSRPSSLDGRLHNVQSITVEEKGVILEQFVQLRNHRMAVGNGLTFC